MNKIKSVFESSKKVSEEDNTSSVGLADEEREKNLNPLRTIVSDEAAFDPITSRLQDVVDADEYAAVKVLDDSPYPEVRGAVPSSDDPSMPQSTIRAWVLGFILTTIGCGMNLLFSLHSPSFSITTYVTSILAWPLGRAWEKVMPNVKIFGVSLNPGPFNIKEHTLITIMGNVSLSGGAAYATDIFLVQNKFYGSDFGWGFEVVSIWATQCIGFALGGIARRILVYPASAIWPLNLVTTVFLTNMHKNENHVANGWKISRLAFFSIVFVGSFVYYWFPGLIFPALSNFSWITWIKPNNVVINQIFGSLSGLGMVPNNIALDWNQIAGYIGSPLIPPASTIATIFATVVFFYWIITPALYYSNTWYAKFMPMSSSVSYDRYGNRYNVSRIINKETLTFNKAEYEKYSPLFLSTTFALLYGLSFASIIATIVHVCFFNGKEIVEQVKMKEQPDVHMRLMRKYKEVPDWWFMIVFLVFFGLSIATVRAWPTEMPVYSLIIALLIAIVFLLPVGIIYSRTNIAVGLNVVTEFIIGYMVPGKPLAMMFFKTFGYITNNQAVTFAQDMKLGHYMKLAPRVVFMGQLIATIWGALVQVAVLRWMYGSVDDLCLKGQKNHYTCPGGTVFYLASIIWGVIGPERIFSQGSVYYHLLFFYVLGLLPIVSWLILRKWPQAPIRWLNWPVFFSGTGQIPPATPYTYTSWCAVGLFFGWYIKLKFFHWWTKYNYSLSAGLDIGLAWSSLIIFLCIQLPGASFPNWWGIDVVNNTLDTNMAAITNVLAEGESFGPDVW